ncbi:MAG: hypothetical protein AOA65_0404 [Candidatus Bathyarchaeota archaeon BA1]|nr:MAG: hypothetical protein AOA65_0404 [Candidatus Bathyarchaeota archaeon BA1]
MTDQRIESDVGTKPFESDLLVEGDWAIWTDILTGREDLVGSLTAKKVEISGNLEKLRPDLIPLLAESIEKAKLPPEMIRLIEPATQT